MRKGSWALTLLATVAAVAASGRGDEGAQADGAAGGISAPPSAAPPADQAPAEPKTAPAPRQFRLAVVGDDLVLLNERSEEVLRIPARLDATYVSEPALPGGEPPQRGELGGVAGQWETDGPYRARSFARSPFTEVRFLVEARPDSPFVETTVEVRYLKDVEVDHEVWSWLPIEAAGRVLDRGYHWRTLDDEELVADRWTPLVGQFVRGAEPSFAFLGDDDFQAARVTRRLIHLELDHWANHPHSVYAKCWPRYAPGHSSTAQSRTLRKDGERATYRLRLVAGEGRMPVLRRWPDDRQAAVVFVDHADKGRSETLRALLYGDSTGQDKERGLLGNGLRVTRTVFDHPRQLQDPEFVALANELVKSGGEIAPHSITPKAETREQIQASLSTTFAAYAPRTWVDHQPDTNCEAINNEGGRRGHDNNVVSLLRSSGVRYLWEAPDPDYRGDLNLLQSTEPSRRAAFFYPAPRIGARTDEDDPWLFATAWMFVPVDKFTARFDERKVNRLQYDHGVHLAHTYLGAVHKSAKHKANTIFERRSDGTLTTRADVEAVWTRLGRRHRRKDLWVTTVGDLGDWMTSWDRLHLRAEGPGRARLVYDGPGMAEVDHGFTVAARWKGTVNGEDRTTLAIGEAFDVKPAIYEDDLGVTLVPGPAVAHAGPLGTGYAAGPESAGLFAVARDLDAPGTDVEDPCVAPLPGAGCGRTALSGLYERLDGLLGLPGASPPERARVLIFGNSLIASDHVTDVLRRRLQKRFGDGGRGIVYVDALKYFGRRAWTGTASPGWYAEYLTQYMGERPSATFPLGMTGGHFVAFKSGATTSWPVGGSREVELYWLDHARAPVLEVKVDGERLTRVVPERSGRAAVTRLSLPEGARSVSLTTEGPRAVVYGASLERPEPGVVVDTVGIVAASANSYLLTDEAVLARQLEARDPALVVFMLGGNEARRIDRGVFSEDEVREDFVRWVERVREAVPNAACLTVGPIETVFVHTPRNRPFETRPYVQYVVDTERELSRAHGCAFIDLYAAMGGSGSLKKFDERGYLSDDRIHPKGPGLDVLGELLSDAVLRGYAQSRADRGRALAFLPGLHAALLEPRDPDAVSCAEVSDDDAHDRAPPPGRARSHR